MAARAPATSAGSSKLNAPSFLQLFTQSLIQLRGGISQAKLYQITTPQYQRIAGEVMAAWTPAFAYAGDIRLSIEGGETLVNGERLTLPQNAELAVRGLERTLHETSLRGVHFQAGLTSDELAQFMQDLAHNKLGSTDGKEINARLRTKGIQHITVNEVIYVAVGEAQANSLGGGGGVPGVGPGASNLVRGVDALVDSLTRVEDVEARAQLQSSMAEELLTKDPALVQDILQAALFDPNHPVPKEVAQWRADPHRDAGCIQALARLMGSLNGAAGAAAASGAAGELMAALLAPYEQRPECWPVLVADLDPVLHPLAPAWMAAYLQRPTGDDPDARAQWLFQLPFALLVEPKGYAEVEALLAHYRGKENRDMFIAVLDRFSQAARLPQTTLRREAVSKLLDLAERYAADPFAFHELLEDFLAEVAQHETDAAILQRLLEYLSARVKAEYRMGNYERARADLDALHAFALSEDHVLGKEAQGMARDALAALGDDVFVAALLNACVDRLEAKLPSQAMLVSLGAAVYPHLAKTVLACGRVARMKSLIAAAAELGAPAVAPVLKELGAQPEGAAALRLLVACEDLLTDQIFAERVGALLRHDAPEIRQYAIEKCFRRKDAIAEEALMGALRAEHDETRVLALASVLCVWGGENHLAEVAALLRRTGGEALGEPTQLEVVKLLSATLNPQIVSLLAPLVQAHPQGGLTGFLGRGKHDAAVSKPVRLAAIKALGPQHADPAVIDLLKPLKQDKDAEIARTAVAVSNGLVKDAPKLVPPVAPVAVDAVPARAAHKGRRTSHFAFDAEPGARRSSASAVNVPAAGSTMAAAATGTVPPKGSIAQYNLERVVTAHEAKHGMVLIKTSLGESRVFLAKGMVVDALHVGLIGYPALQAAAALTDGTYEFVPDIDARHWPLAIPVKQLGDTLAGRIAPVMGADATGGGDDGWSG